MTWPIALIYSSLSNSSSLNLELSHSYKLDPSLLARTQSCIHWIRLFASHQQCWQSLPHMFLASYTNDQYHNLLQKQPNQLLKILSIFTIKVSKTILSTNPSTLLSMAIPPSLMLSNLTKASFNLWVSCILRLLLMLMMRLRLISTK